LFVSRGISISDITFQKGNNSIARVKDITFFTFSREALLRILEFNQLGENDEILLPEFICSTVIESILPVTKKIRFYNIDNYLNYNHHEISKAITENTKLVLFVDYFGVETQIKCELQTQLESQNIIVVKDSAHAFLTLANQNFLSTNKYDYLITSVYKNIPFQAGAITKGNLGDSRDFVSLYVLFTRYFVLALKNIFCFFGFKKLVFKDLNKISISNSTNISRKKGPNVCLFYKLLLFKLDLVTVVRKRKCMTRQFNKFFLGNQKFRPLFTQEQIENSVLQDYPVYFNEQLERDKYLKILNDNFIDAYTWPTFHLINCNEKLWSRVLILPISDRVLRVLRDV